MASISKEDAQALDKTITTQKTIRRAVQEGLLTETEKTIVGEYSGKRGSLTKYKAIDPVDLEIGEPKYHGNVNQIVSIELGLPCGLITAKSSGVDQEKIIFGRAVLGISKSHS